MLDFLSQSLDLPGQIGLVAGAAAMLFLLFKLGNKQSKAKSQKFLASCPDAATLYLYAEDLPDNGGEVECLRGVASKVFAAKDAPSGRVTKGAACHLLPGVVDCEVTVTWTSNYFAARKHSRMSARFTVDARPGCDYAAVFNTKSQKARLLVLDGN